jgi:hypothetical protein
MSKVPDIDTVKPHEMSVMKSMCGTCPFSEHGCKEVRARVMTRIIDKSQHCHSTGHLSTTGTHATHLCRGARDQQLIVMHRLGVIEAPTDEAWTKAWTAMVNEGSRS